MSCIIPPPGIKEIVDKTAAFVAKNGPQFEDRIQENEKGNIKFVFMNQGDPYRAYYDFKLGWFRDHPTETPKEAVKRDRPTRKQKKIEIPTEPPLLDFNIECPAIQPQDLDIIKLVALFVAKNGKQFMVNLSEKESTNSQLDFLRPTHSVFKFFTQLVDQYSKIINPPKNIVANLERDAKDKSGVLERIMKRVEYTVYHDTLKKKVDAESEAERIAFGEIDWHDFVLVDTIEFVAGDDKLVFPIPLVKADLEKIVFMVDREDYEMDLDETESKKIKTL